MAVRQFELQPGSPELVIAGSVAVLSVAVLSVWPPLWVSVRLAVAPPSVGVATVELLAADIVTVAPSVTVVGSAAVWPEGSPLLQAGARDRARSVRDNLIAAG